MSSVREEKRRPQVSAKRKTAARRRRIWRAVIRTTERLEALNRSLAALSCRLKGAE